MATRSRKCNFQELDSLKKADKPLPNFSLHAAIKSISHVKKGRNSIFFDGVIADGNTKMRLVGFNSDQQKKMNYFFHAKIPANIQSCEIKQSRQGFQMEVMLKSTTHTSKKLTSPLQRLMNQKHHLLSHSTHCTKYRTFSV